MAPELEIRRGVPDDRERILDLMRLSLDTSGVPRTMSYWVWKHELNPFGSSPVLLATSGSELVGLRVFSRWAFRDASRSWKAVRAVDTATHPEWRGKGIFTTLTKALLEQMREEGVDFIFNTPNKLSRPGYLKMGWQDVGRLSAWVRPLRPSALISAIVDRSGQQPPPETGGDHASLGAEVGELCEQAAFGALLEALSLSGRLSTPRTLGYIRWRYADVPGIVYRASWYLDGSVGAALVFRLRRRAGLIELRLCEVLVGPCNRSRRAARELLRQLLSEVAADYAVAMTVTGAQSRAVLTPVGFAPVPRVAPILTVRPLAAPGQEIDPTRRSAWRLAIGDLELF